MCNHGDVRLYGGHSRADGSAEICLSGVWTVMCSQNWGSTDSTVFCRQLLGRSSIAALYTTCCKRVPPTSNTALMSVSCSVTSNPRIDNDCNYQLVRGYSSSSCSPVTIGCYVTGFSCVTGALRLVNRDRIGMNEGTVEVCQSGRWGTITYTSWGLPDAEVVCRQLGYQGNWSLYHYTASIQNQSPHLLHQMLCNGNEASLLNCRYTRLSLSISSSLRYNSYPAAAVTCQGNSSQLSRECTSGDVRLANSSNNNMEGRVEICTSGTWVSVCDSNWRSYETQAFCKQLGHTIPGSFAVHGGFYGTTDIPIIYGVTCNSNSPNVSSCTIHHQSNSGNCHHGRDVGVVCQDSASVFRVTVTSNATGPVQLGDAVELHCSISPDPSIGRPVQLLYSWRGDNNLRFGTSSPNWTVLIEYTHYETTNYICTVSINNHILATGSIDIHAKDFLILSATLSPSQPVGLDNLTLEVNITSDSAKYIMRNLSWYFNGNLIQNSPNTTIYNDNKTLTTTDSTAGVYEVRYDGLLLANPYNSVCEKMILSNLRHYPLFKPMYYLINTQELMNQRPTISILFNGAIESVITFTNGDNFTLKAVGQLATSIEPSEVDIVWYFNGYSVVPSSHVQNRNFISRDLSRTSSTYLHDGIYEALLVWNMNQECSSYYRQLSNNPVILARTSIEVRYFVSLDHSFSADKNALSSNEAALLRCSATIRYPPLSSISIVKNNITLQTTTGTTLSVRTGRMGVSTFGLYQCRVDTTRVPISLKLRIKEKVHLMIEFEIKGHLECRKNNVFIRMVEASVTAKLRGDCSCNITANDLQMSLLQCNNAQTVTFSTLVVFSSDSGDETASTLTNRLSSQVSASAVHLDLNGNKALITSACTDCSSHHGANAGIFFGGVIFSMVLIALLAMVVYIRYRRKSSENVNLPIRAATNIVNEERYTNCDEQLQRGRKPTVYKKKPEISTRKKVAKPAVPVRTDSLARTNKTRVAEVENIDLELYEVMDGPDNIDQEVYEECA